MSFDMSQFYGVFFEESKEHLASMEASLLGVDVSAPDGETLNAIFRAAHSIKGSAATFAFTDVAEFTHVLETLLDRVRKNEIRLSEEIVDASLAAGDVLRNLLAAHEGLEAADAAAADTMRLRLDALCEVVDTAAVPAAEPAVEEKRSFLYRIGFAAAHGDPRSAAGIDSLLAELREIGEVRDATPPSEAATDWKVLLATSMDAGTLRSIMEFVVESGSIAIETLESSADAANPPDDDAFGFFDSAPGAPRQDDEAYGFFAPLAEPVGTTLADADPGYGFFEPLATPVAPSDAPSRDIAGFGLFEPEAPPTPVASVAPAPSPAARENVPARARGDGGSIRVNVERVDQLINLAGEMVITQAMLSQAAAQIDPVLFERLHKGIGLLERNTRDLQEAVMSIRMLPISTVFSRFPRVVRDLSQKLGKQVELVLSGESTELDKTLIELISDPLTHLVRNSLDHGIESPQRRTAAGKSPGGRINLRAYHQSGNIVLEVADDGAGLNRERILAKARERGLPVTDSMADQDVWQLIFEPGFSTADTVTDVSGRGVGMDVVKKNIAALGGRIELESMLGMGTRVTVRLPLTLAILDGMSVGLGDETYIVPLDYVVESLQPASGMLKSVSGAERLLDVRGEYLPILDLREALDMPGERGPFENGIMVVIEADCGKAAIYVDALIGQHQVVIKSLEANYRRVAGISGATIMGDGHVALILDPPRLVAMARRTAPASA